MDRAFTYADWNFLFPIATVTNMPAIGSDHSPIVIDTYPDFKRNSRSLKYEAFWSDEPSYKLVVKQLGRKNKKQVI